jgi:hypothetical protein
MLAVRRGAIVALASVALPFGATACNAERKQQCDTLLAAMKPLDQGTPSSAMVDTVHKQIAAMTFQDATLGIYAKNYGATLTILANTLQLQEGASPPDGTADVVKQNLQKVRTDRDDVQRYCAQ